MNRKVLSYNEYKQNYRKADLNEGFLDSVLNFFKGIFDLISDKKVKKESEEISSYFQRISDNDELKDEEIEEEIDVKKVRNYSTRLSDSIKNRIEVDEENEKSIMTNKGLIKAFSSWVAMIVAQQESLKMNFIEKMLNNNDLSKRFIFVPKDSREDLMAWYKKAEAIDPRVKKAWSKMMETPPKGRQAAIQEFCKNFIGFSVEKNYEDGLTRLKSNDKAFIEDVYSGLAAMCNGIVAGMQMVLKSTPDDKIAEVISQTIIDQREENAPQERSRKKKSFTAGDKVEVYSAEDDVKNSSRSRKKSKTSI